MRSSTLLALCAALSTLVVSSVAEPVRGIERRASTNARCTRNAATRGTGRGRGTANQGGFGTTGTSNGRRGGNGNGNGGNGNGGNGNGGNGNGGNGNGNGGNNGNGGSNGNGNGNGNGGNGNGNGGNGNGGNGNGGNGNGGNGNGGNIQSSTTLDSSVIQDGSAQDGNPTNGQVASLTSTNNFINFCASQQALGAPLMNGTQTKSQAACNPIPMGMIVSQNNMPSCKFINPKNLDKIQANTAFTIQMKIKNMVSGNFVNPNTNYFSAPAQIDSQSGNVIGHSHFVIEAIDSLQSTTVTNPLQFAFFKGVDPPAQNGIMSVNVPGGLPAGTYRLASINSAANHQPVLSTIAQHGSFDDMVYFQAA